MPRIASWFQRSSIPSRRSRRIGKRKGDARTRRLGFEQLEGRRMLAYTVTESGSVGNETLVITKALGDTSNLTITSDASGNLTFADSGNMFTGGPFTGVTIGTNSVSTTAAQAGVVHLKIDLTSSNTDVQNLTIGNLNGATIPGFDVVASQGTATVTLAASTIAVGGSTAANASIDFGVPVIVAAPSTSISSTWLSQRGREPITTTPVPLVRFNTDPSIFE